MAAYPLRNLIATAPDGTEVVFPTRGGYTHAGLVQRGDKSWVIAYQGTSPDSVDKRTRGVYNHGDCLDYAVVPLLEETAPLLRARLGTHDVGIDKVYTSRPGARQDPMLQPGWRMAWDAGYGTRDRKLRATRRVLKQIARDGYTQVAVISFGSDPKIMHFATADVIASLKQDQSVDA